MTRKSRAKSKSHQESGGRFVRNPETGELTRADDQVSYGKEAAKLPQTVSEPVAPPKHQKDK